MRNISKTWLIAFIAATSAAVAMACGGSSTPAPTTPSGVVSGSIGATISITANGATPIDVRIEPTQRVRIVNNDNRPHQINTNPHNFHTDCPANNTIVINPGQQVDTAIFTAVRACGYHNHLLPDEQKYWGTIRVGTDDTHRGPVYSRGW